jgi:N-acyl homoserine lactone hydrolase
MIGMRVALILLLSLAVSACDPPATAQDPSSIRLYVMDGGILESDPARYRLTPGEVATTQLSVASYVIVHPRGILMWDAGAVPDADWTATGASVKHQLVLPNREERTVTLSAKLGSQLAAAGYGPGDVTHVALSHYHWDHTANANAFAAATWLVAKAERDEMFAEKPFGNVRPATYDALKSSRTVILGSGDHDVFGDGRVVIKQAPGHTPAHQVLYVRLQRTGGVVLSGDLYHYEEERTLDRLPTFEFNEGQTRAARRSLDAFLQKAGARLWIQHHLPAHQALRKAPAYYD